MLPACKSFEYVVIHTFRDVLGPSSHHFHCGCQMLVSLSEIQVRHKYTTSFFVFESIPPKISDECTKRMSSKSIESPLRLIMIGHVIFANNILTLIFF